MCAHALNLAGIKKVVFACKNDKFGGQGSILSLQKIGKIEVIKGVKEKEAVEVLQKFYEHGNQKLPEDKRHRK